jgi:GrpB-like predicted nucleotidyltransferase (UPF0157 family)
MFSLKRLLQMNQNTVEEIIELVPFNPQWEKTYQLESFRIKEKLGSSILDMRHIGSTAIPNIFAKPIIDIMIGIHNINSTETIIKQLIELGYEYLAEAGIPGRLYFRIRGKENYNIALCTYQGEIWENNLLFADYLRKHPVIAKRYSILKQELFNSGVNSLLKYSQLKSSFIDEIIKKAKKG